MRGPAFIMAGSAHIIEDASTLSRLDRLLLRIEEKLALVSGLAVFSLMLLAVLQVTGRNGFEQPLPGYVDWIEQAMPLIAFMGISYVQREGGHIRMDMFIGRLKGRPLFLAEFIGTLAILLLIVLLTWGSWAHFSRSFDFGAPMWSRDSTMDIALPLWPAKLLAPVAFGVLGIRLALQLWAWARALVTGVAVGVPLPVDVATQAAMEAEQVSDGND